MALTQRQRQARRLWMARALGLGYESTTSTLALSMFDVVSFASASQPYNATGISISDSLPSPIPTDNLIFAFDLVDDYFYWDGATRAIGDATNNGDGSYSITLSADIDFGNASGFVEYTSGASPVENQCLFSGSKGTTNRFEIANGTGGTWSQRIYDQATALYGNSAGEINEGLQLAQVRVRSAWAYKAGSPKKLVNAGSSVNSSEENAAANLCNAIGIARRIRFNDKIYDGTFHRVYVYSSDRTEAELQALVANNGSQIGSFWVGDSFLNSGQIKLDFSKLVTARSQYFPTAQWNVGSSSLTDQASDFASNRSRFFDQTLVIMDGGFDGTGEQALAAIASMVSNLGHDRWVYVQSNPISADGDPARDAWDAKDATVYAYCGDAHYCETLTVMQSNGDGGATDLADIANNIWPTSLRSDATHPNAAGQAILAQAIYDHMIEQGWLAYTITLTIAGGGTLSVTGATSATVTGDDTATLRVSGDLADVNTELGTLEITGLSAGSHALTASLYDPVTGQTKQKTATVIVT